MKIELHLTIVLDVLYCSCILHNLTIKNMLDLEEFMHRMSLEVENEMHLRESEQCRITQEMTIKHNLALEWRDTSNEQVCKHLVHYLNIQLTRRL